MNIIINNRGLVYYLVVLVILTLPYMNFPFTSAGLLKPLSLLPLFFISLMYKNIYFNRNFYIFLIILLLLILYSLYLTYIIPLDILDNKPLRNQYIGLLQFIIFGFYSYIAFYIGKYVIPKYLHENNFYKIFLLAYYPSLIFGVIHVVTINIGMENPIFFIRNIFASTVYPATYYRNMMLTAEPSLAAIDLMLIILPIALMYYFNKKSFFSFLTLLLLLINLLGTKSGLGYFIMLISLLFLVVNKINNIKSIFIYVIPMLLVSLLILKNSSYITERAIKISVNYENDDILEESFATRYIPFFIAKDILLNNPMGIGYSNEGYYFREYLPEEYFGFPLFNDWIDPNSTRFPDLKSSISKFIIAFGLIGIILLSYILYKLLNIIIKTKNAIIKLFLINIFVVSLTFSIIGYIPIFILIGYFSSLKLKKENIKGVI